MTFQSSPQRHGTHLSTLDAGLGKQQFYCWWKKSQTTHLGLGCINPCKWWEIYCTTLTGFQPSTVSTFVECVFLRFFRFLAQCECPAHAPSRRLGDRNCFDQVIWEASIGSSIKLASHTNMVVGKPLVYYFPIYNGFWASFSGAILVFWGPKFQEISSYPKSKVSAEPLLSHVSTRCKQKWHHASLIGSMCSIFTYIWLMFYGECRYIHVSYGSCLRIVANGHCPGWPFYKK